MHRLMTIAVLFAAAGAARAQERPAEMKEDLWYKVTRAGDESKFVGFIHITVETVTEEGKAFYHYYEEGSISETGFERGFRHDYLFDTDLVLVRGESLERAQDFEANVKAVFDGRVLTRACVTPALEQVIPWSREKTCWPANFIPVALMRKQGPWEAGKEMEASTFGHDWKPVKDNTGKESLEFTLIEPLYVYVVKGQGRRQVVDMEQNCWMLEAVRKDKPQAGIVSMVVDSRGFLVELLDSRFVIRRVKDDVAARNGNKFIWAHGGRRDPFRHPMKPKEVKKVTPGTEKPVDVLSLQQIKQLLDKAQNHLTAMQSAMNLPEVERERILAQKNTEINLIAGTLRQTGDVNAIQQINNVIAAAGKLYDPVRAAVTSARALLVDITNKFKTGEKELLTKIPALVDRMRAIAQAPELAGRPEQPQVNQMLDSAATYEKRAKIVIEGKEKTKDLRPNGIMYVLTPKPFDVQLGLALLGARLTAETTITLPVSESVVLMGAGSYIEGDLLKEIEDCTVMSIRPDGVDLNYKGEKITLSLSENKR